MSKKLDALIKFMPKELKPGSNPILNALLTAWAGGDEEIATQLANTKAQLFVKTAEGSYLDRLASNYGIARPDFGIIDSDFEQLIPNLSWKVKGISNSFYETMDVFWGPLFSRANSTSTQSEPFAVNVGDDFEIRIDGGVTQRLTIKPGDLRTAGAATAAEMVRILNRFTGLTTSVINSPSLSSLQVNVRTNTPGIRGSVEFVSGFDVLGFAQDVKYRVSNLKQRTVLYQVNAGEIIIELPAIIPTLKRTLKGSHHFHTNSTLEVPVPPENGIWQGSFVYSTVENPFTATSLKTTLSSTILKGSILNQITVADTSVFPVGGGNLIFDFGRGAQEYPVKYLAATNANTLLIDPGHTFQSTHLSGASVNYLAPNQTTPYAPTKDGGDLAVYLTSPANARSSVQSLLTSLAAAGIIVTFVVLLPTYRYLLTNPYDL